MSRKTRKLIWSVPLVAVLAVAGALAMFVALEPRGVFANPLPAAPSNLLVTPAPGNEGRTTLVLTWDAPAGGNVTDYRIDRSMDGFVWETLEMDTGDTARTAMDDSLAASQTRWYRVFALNEHGESPLAVPDKGTTKAKGAPGPVQNLRATAMGQRQINLTWDEPADNGGVEITGYQIQYHNGDIWVGLRAQTDANANSYLLVTADAYMENGGYQDKDGDDPSLDPGEMRRYQVRAVNSADPNAPGEDDVSQEPKATEGWGRADATTASANSPGAPSGLTVVNIGTINGSLSLYWFAPTSDGGWPISHYIIQVRRYGEDWADLPDDVATLSPVPKNGGDINEDGGTFRITAVVAEDVVQKSFGGVPHEWDDDGDGGTTPEVPLYLDFRVFAQTTDDGANDETGGGDDTPIMGTTSSEISYRVQAVLRALTDADNDGSTPMADKYGAPELGATTGTTALDEQIDLSIKRPDNVGTQNIYRIDVSEDDGKTWKLLVGSTLFTGFDGERRVYEHENLGYDATRNYRAFAIASDWRTTAGPASVESNAGPTVGMTAESDAPGKVTGVMASAPDLMTIEAVWSAPEEDGGQPIARYMIQYVRDDGDDVPDVGDWSLSNPNGAPMVHITDDAALMETFDATLVKEKPYRIRVAAVNKNGAGDFRPADENSSGDDAPIWSDGFSFTTGEPTPPNMVEGLTSEEATDTSSTDPGVLLLWNKPSSGTDVGNYVVEVSTDGGTTWETPEDGDDVTKFRTTYTDPDDEFEMDETRIYRVAAENEAGMGEWTMVDYPRYPAADHPHALPDVGDASGLMATAGSDTGTAVLTWTPGTDANIHWLLGVAVNADGSFDFGDPNRKWMKVEAGSPYTVTELTAGRTYSFAIISGYYDASLTPDTDWSDWVWFDNVTVN